MCSVWSSSHWTLFDSQSWWYCGGHDEDPTLRGLNPCRGKKSNTLYQIFYKMSFKVYKVFYTFFSTF